ncbi:MAG: hypothetical protein VYE81_07660 [Planctomycetota bacterium]|nr:hypothetical protein [Planctomycetota bacterium]
MSSPIGLIAALCLVGASQSTQEPAANPRQKALDAIDAAGGRVTQISAETIELSVNFSLHGKTVSDAVLALLVQVPEIRELRLGRTAVGDSALIHVGALEQLERLYLEKTAVTDAGLAHLDGLQALVYLNLYGTAVGDEGLAHLAGLANLRKLFVWETKVTEEGAAQLSASLPSLSVNRGWDERPQVAPPVEGTCCDKAQAEGKACAHPCCVEATGKGEVCKKCNPG